MKQLLFPFLFLACFGAQAQTFDQLLKFADENAKGGDYYGASLYYQKALRIDSTDIELLWKYAECLRLYNNYEKAEYYYDKVFDREEGMKYPESQFNLAMMQKMNGRYKQAGETFKAVNKKFQKDKKSYYFLKSKKEIQSCKFAEAQAKHVDTTGFKIYNAGKNINSFDSEFAALLTDSSVMFSTMRAADARGDEEVYDKLYYTRLYEVIGTPGKQKGVSKKVNAEINNLPAHTGNGCFSGDGKRFYYTACDSIGQCKIMVSMITKAGATAGREVEGDVNVKGYTSTQPTIADINGKEYLFYSSNKPDGIGKMDLWYCELSNNGEKVGKQKNAGRIINSIDDEKTPFYDPYEQVLYFSSNWHEGFGGMDIFKITGEPGNFGQPINMGLPVNSSVNDLYFFKDRKNEYALLTSNRVGSMFKKSPTCCNDIYIIEYPKKEDPPKDTVPYANLVELNRYLPVTLYFHNDEPGPKSFDTAVKFNYMTTYEEYSKLHDKYREEFSKDYEEPKKSKAKTAVDNFYSDYVDKGVSDLEIFTKLLLEELKKGYEIELTIKGFASPLAKTDYNVKLTKRRISTLMNYLREYNNGEFVPYLNGTAPNGGKLVFEKIPFGEYTAEKGVSDDYYDQRNSIYNPSAALERKIEIQTVQRASKDSLMAQIKVDKEAFDFGATKKGDVLTHKFKIKNTGQAVLKIENIIAYCDCIKGKATVVELKPGESTEVEVTWDTAGSEGKQVRSVTLVTNGFPPNKRLVVTTEVK
ncbi:MAG TPA: DUF1573 domain-containing protein [Flavobacteriales bacterium]|nr:DUF1573 domain-containing protein [Flavobacteriales bacterium]